MNLVLLLPEDLVAPDRARLTGRRLAHVREVHRAAVGDDLAVGLLGGRMGRGRVLRLDDTALELSLVLDQDPPPKLPLTLVVALPRPKVLNRVVAASASLGVARLVLVNAWKVEKAYWSSPRMAPENLREQLLLGLEQAKDTVLPELRLARLFRPFVEDELPALVGGGTGLVAHPGSAQPFPAVLAAPLTLAIGPEGGWIDAEFQSLLRAGLRPLDLGPRILRTETALAALVGRLGL
ncbi:ribosomal RNA small subunit methyltransferase E [Geothrix rubra]|uniref:Ribosomal RNA small subunit methyltransferase E n=1 Tax=Geothrix rubra TaxID=2927977 RepID=A0ABQ5Q3G3_9BACT|nr:16S rRNA (uracil(1498)-N(3))-methyltransferase [Geothrix rubra]GLH68909.1 ribosomal RNA small subunit methyltransferase E [Geothrix rubra]